MPIKSPGGYQLIDMKGEEFVISPSSTTISDPDICGIFRQIYLEGNKKPVYITNFKVKDGPELIGPRLLETWNREDDLVYCNIFGIDGTPNITLKIDLSHVVEPGVVYISKIEH